MPLGPRALGIYIKKITRAYVATITYVPESLLDGQDPSKLYVIELKQVSRNRTLNNGRNTKEPIYMDAKLT